MKLTLEGEIDEIAKVLNKIIVENDTRQGKITTTYCLSQCEPGFIFDDLDHDNNIKS